MSLALADLLIDVSDPVKLIEFKENPERFMSRYELTMGDKAALRSGKGGWIRFQAKSLEDEANINSNHPAIIAAEFAGELVEVDLMVEISNTTTDQVTETDDPDSGEEAKTLFIGDDGTLYKAVRVL
jgi:hypothetical protein